jgi:hypothetical protein
VSVSGKWQVTLGDEDLGVFDENTFTVGDAFVLEGNADLTVVEMLRGIQERRAKATRALVWFMRFKKGDTTHITAMEDFPLASLKMDVIPDPKEETESVPDETSTSELSPSISE